jgi:pyruvate dehydrogenase E2 component (dihydrolipoamide acetyltransferase)
MRYIFKFPDIGEGLDEGTILIWYVSKGQKIKFGDPVVKMETDKVVTDIPSPKSGTVVATYGKVGETVHVGTSLIELEIEGTAEEIKTEVIKEGSAGVVGTIEVAGNNAYLPKSDEGFENTSGKSETVRKILATPVARAMAKEMNVDINNVTGTGPGNRVMKEDIQNYINGKIKVGLPKIVISEERSELYTFEPLSQIRKTIAKNMAMSKQNAVHMTVHEEVEVSELIRIREKYKKIYAEQNIKLTYLSFILKAVAMALKHHRALNAQLDLENNRMIYKNFYNIGIAVDTAEGLVVPVIRDVDKLEIHEIATKITELSEKAKERKLTLEELKDGTFTITNYGSIGGIFGVPVINYPQAGILGVGRMLKKPIVKNDKIEIGNILPLSLTVDHRIIDGGEATRFIIQIMKYLEEPVAMEL